LPVAAASFQVPQAVTVIWKLVRAVPAPSLAVTKTSNSVPGDLPVARLSARGVCKSNQKPVPAECFRACHGRA
jgi:hypothetical protein